MCRCAKTMLKLLDLVVKFFFLVILTELIIKCVIRFGGIVRILEDQCKW